MNHLIFRKVKIESLVDLEWSIAGTPLVVDKLFYIPKVRDSPLIKAVSPAMDWSSDKRVTHSLLGDLG